MPQQGTVVPLTVTLYAYSGGPVADPVSPPTVTIMSGDDVIAGPFTTPAVVRDGLGLYRYPWLIPATATPGTYVAKWEAVMAPDAEPSVGYDFFEVSAYNPSADDSACLWPVDPACLQETWENFPQEVQMRSLRLASATLHALTAQRVGGCPITVRPQGRLGACFIPSMGGLPFYPGMNVAGQWVNNCGVSSSICEVPLPHPVGRVDEVKVDGEVIDPSLYRIDNGRLLVWQGGGDCPWPIQQDMSLPDTEVGTFAVTMLNAYPVDAMGAHAAGLLAVEYGKACSGGKCRLPSNVTSVVRQGVTMEIRPGWFPDGFTGIREVDAFISMWNPRGRRQQTTVWSPDLPQYRHTTSGG